MRDVRFWGAGPKADMQQRRRESCASGHPDYFAAGGRSLSSIRDCSALRNESSVSIVFVNPAWRSLTVLTKARGPAGAPYANAKSACWSPWPTSFRRFRERRSYFATIRSQTPTFSARYAATLVGVSGPGSTPRVSAMAGHTLRHSNTSPLVMLNAWFAAWGDCAAQTITSATRSASAASHTNDGLPRRLRWRGQRSTRLGSDR